MAQFSFSPTANVTRSARFKEPRAVFVGRAISHGLLPPRSATLTPCDGYLWRHLKDKVHKTNHHTLEEHIKHPPRDFNNFRERTPER
jgi:hypothetical protein